MSTFQTAAIAAGLDTDLGFVLVRASAVVMKEVNQALTPLGLRARHLTLLQVAAAEALPQREISALVGLDPSNVVSLIDDLQDQGLIVRQPDPRDRRARLVAITEDGKRVYRDARRIADDAVSLITAGMSEADRGNLIGLLASMLPAD